MVRHKGDAEGHFLRREDKEGHLEVSFIAGTFLRISVERLISFLIFNGVLSGFLCWKLWQKPFMPFVTTGTRGRGPNKALSQCQGTLCYLDSCIVSSHSICNI